MAKPKTNRQKQALNTKNKIFNVSMSLFEKYGYDNVHIKDIANKANISVGTFYHYYKSKEDVFFELYARADDYFASTVKNKLKEENTLERIVEFFDYYAILTIDTGIDTLRQMLTINNKNYIKKGRAMQQVLIDIINEGQKKGEIVNTASAEKLCEDLFIVARGVVFDWGLHEGDYNIREKMNYITSQFANVILKR